MVLLFVSSLIHSVTWLLARFIYFTCFVHVDSYFLHDALVSLNDFNCIDGDFFPLSLGRLSREDMEKLLFIPLSTLSCCESKESVIKIQLFYFPSVSRSSLCAFFSGNNECFIAIYSSCASSRSYVVYTELKKI